MAPSPGKVTFYRPGRSFPAVSITGRLCELGCDYCHGHYLEGMIAASTGEELYGLALELEGRGARGLLLSGGCDRSGKIDFQGFLASVARIKSRTKLAVNVHTGLLDTAEEARALVSSGADCFSVDIVQDPDVIGRRMHLDRGPEDYRRTLELLFVAGASRVVPHVCIGISEVSKFELAALHLISRYPVGSVVLLSFLPAKGTPMFDEARPSRERVLEVAKQAIRLVDAPVLMGCMRPRGDWELEADLLSLGVAGMAMPSPRTVRWAEENGFDVQWREECCALHR
ncbi:MAG TPA: radical SAM protein [Methanomassiliicoccales archaeon]|nr:radical SAM protein [Methanomassiliicoccales archaeon]